MILEANEQVMVVVDLVLAMTVTVGAVDVTSEIPQRCIVCQFGDADDAAASLLLLRESGSVDCGTKKPYTILALRSSSAFLRLAK